MSLTYLQLGSASEQKPLPISQQPFPFLALPPELRLQIYRHALPTNQSIFLIPPAGIRSHFPFFPPSFPPLLHVSSFVRKEAQEIYYSSSAFVLAVDAPDTLLRIPGLLDTFAHGRSDGGDIFGLIRDFRVRVGNNVMIDVCGPKARRKRYGCRVMVSKDPFGAMKELLREKPEVERSVGRVLEVIDASNSGVTVGVVGAIIKAIFKEDGMTKMATRAFEGLGTI